MNQVALKSVLAALSVACITLVMSGPTASAAETSATARPLNVKVASIDGRPRVKVARQLKSLVSCSNSCTAIARFTLRTPANTLRLKSQQRLSASEIWTTGIQLTNFGLRYLRQNYRRSVFTVAVTAFDRETRKKTVRVRHFRFYR